MKILKKMHIHDAKEHTKFLDSVYSDTIIRIIRVFSRIRKDNSDIPSIY